jgi:hypothetical protein
MSCIIANSLCGPFLYESLPRSYYCKADLKKLPYGERHRHRYEFNSKFRDQFKKAGKAKAIRFITLSAICAYLQCQPGDILEFKED